MKEEKKNKQKEKQAAKTENLAGAGNHILARGRIFSGIVTKKFHKRIVLEFERTLYAKKYERFYRKKTRIHARLPFGMNVNLGDYVKVQECRPLSKIIHHVVIEKIKPAENPQAAQSSGDKGEKAK